MQAALVTFDHLALAFLGCYGTTRLRTPQFDRLASGSVVFDQCYGVAGGGGAFGGLTELIQRLQTCGGLSVVHRRGLDAMTDAGQRDAIAAWRRAAGHGAGALLWLQSPGIASPWTASTDRIVAAWRSAFPNDALTGALAECGLEPVEGADPADTIAAAWPRLVSAGWLSRGQAPTTQAIGRLRWCVYAAAVSALDEWLGAVLAQLLDADSHESLLIVAAAAGDLTGPHAELAAGCPPLIDPLVHVPLLVRTATSSDGTRRNALVSVSDLGPTLAEWFQIGQAGAVFDSGRSLWPLLNGELPAIRDRLLIGSIDVGWSLRTREYVCLARTADLAHELPELAWLFVKPDDAWESLNVARQLPEITAEYCRRIAASREASAPG